MTWPPGARVLLRLLGHPCTCNNITNCYCGISHAGPAACFSCSVEPLSSNKDKYRTSKQSCVTVNPSNRHHRTTTTCMPGQHLVCQLHAHSVFRTEVRSLQDAVRAAARSAGPTSHARRAAGGCCGAPPHCIMAHRQTHQHTQ